MPDVERSLRNRPPVSGFIFGPRPLAFGLLFFFLAACGKTPPPASWPGQATAVAPGVELFQSSDPSLVESAGAISMSLLRLDPERVQLISALSNDAVVDAEPVDAIAARHQAVAAINGGFFNVKNGEPTGVLKVRGELVSDSSLGRGAVVIWSPPGGRTELAFDQLAAKVTMSFRAEGYDWVGADRRRRHDACSRQGDALHAGVPRQHRHRHEGRRMGDSRRRQAGRLGNPQGCRTHADSARRRRDLVRRPRTARGARGARCRHTRPLRDLLEVGQRPRDAGNSNAPITSSTAPVCYASTARRRRTGRPTSGWCRIRSSTRDIHER